MQNLAWSNNLHNVVYNMKQGLIHDKGHSTQNLSKNERPLIESVFSPSQIKKQIAAAKWE